MEKITFSWSGGKDSAMALHQLQKNIDYEIVSLHTIINKETGRVGMHGVREDLIRKQAASIGIPIEIIYLEKDLTNESYEKALLKFCNEQKNKGVNTIAYGDIFLEDLKQYRIEKLTIVDMKAIFPLWKKDTTQLIHHFITNGFETVICSASAKFFTEDDAGKVINEGFLTSLPTGVDPCGENGEFHTFVFKGPIFKEAITFNFGEKTYQTYDLKDTDSKEEKGFWFIDLY